MTRRKNNVSSYKITGVNGEYIVTLEGLKNDYNGNPRYKATLICLGSGTDCFYSPVYTFTGHFCGELGECENIVKYHENNNK